MALERHQTIYDFTAEEIRDMGLKNPEDVHILRRRAFKANVSKMRVPGKLKKWVGDMERRYGTRVQIWTHRLPWLEALMVARWGEDPTQWPPEFNDADVQRAENWLSGRQAAPVGVRYIDPNEE